MTERTADVTLAGKYVSSDFHLAKDGQGGTLVTAKLPPAATVRFVEAAAGLLIW